MGLPKATLPFGPETMVVRVGRVLSTVVSPIVVVAAEGQPLPDFKLPVQIVRDQRPERGPLEGLAAGLTALASQVDAAYVTSCDVPLLEPGFVKRMIARLGEREAAVPVQADMLHPLAAVYRTSVLKAIRSLLAADQLRMMGIFDLVDTVRVPVEELADVDPPLHTLRNLNTPADYLAALASAGFAAPPAVLQKLQREA